MNVSQIMTTGVVTVGLDDKLARVKELFDHYRFHRDSREEGPPDHA
jgi:hypothetical protein